MENREKTLIIPSNTDSIIRYRNKHISNEKDNNFVIIDSKLGEKIIIYSIISNSKNIRIGFSNSSTIEKKIFGYSQDKSPVDLSSLFNSAPLVINYHEKEKYSNLVVSTSDDVDEDNIVVAYAVYKE